MAKKTSPMDRVRIIGIFAHVDAGKTTTSEAFLYFTGRIHRAGGIDEGAFRGRMEENMSRRWAGVRVGEVPS